MANLAPRWRRQVANLVGYLQKQYNTAIQVYYTWKSGFWGLCEDRVSWGLGVGRLIKGLVVSKFIGWLVGWVGSAPQRDPP